VVSKRKGEFIYLTPCVPLSFPLSWEERGRKKKEGLSPLLNALLFAEY